MSRRQFGPDGCLALIGDRICGEQETLQIIQQFKRLYESKLQQIEDEAGGGDCVPGLQAKVSLQQEWIRDLTQQNELLVRAVEELEQEASSRVAMLEQKLEMSVRKGSETVEELEAKKQMLENMEDKIREMPSQEDLDSIAAKLQAREEELIAVKRSMMDMRNALTIEVADKHDIILNLRRDVQQLEDQCRQSNKQTQFKDDIIKELRKEIKQLKVEVPPVEISTLFQNYQDCYTSVRSLHALDLKINNYPLQSKKSSKINEEIGPEKDNKGKEPFIFIRENPSAPQSAHKRSSLVFIKEQLGLESYKPSQFSQMNNELQKIALTKQSSVMDVQSNLLHLINFNPACKHDSEVLPGMNRFIERYKLFKRSKPRGKLTAKMILHEYYGVKHQDIYGVVENFTESSKTSFVSVPDHVPVKIFVTNLERNVDDTCSATKIHSKKNMSNSDCQSKRSI